MTSVAPAVAGTPRISFQMMLRHRWQALASRERLALLFMLLALSAAAIWLGWLQPLLRERTHLQTELPRLQAQAHELEPLLRARALQRQQQAQTPGLLQVQQQLKDAGLAAMVRIDAGAGTGTWHMQVRDVPADVFWSWLLPLLEAPGVSLQHLQLQRSGDENMPAARLSGSIQIQVAAAGGRQ